MTGRLWTDAEVSYLASLAWDAGRHYERHRIADAYAELEACWRPVGRKAYAERVAERVAEMERFDVAAWRAESRRNAEVRDRQAREIGGRLGPALRSWREVHASVSPTVWARIWGELDGRTRADLADLNPAAPRRRLEVAA